MRSSFKLAVEQDLQRLCVQMLEQVHEGLVKYVHDFYASETKLDVVPVLAKAARQFCRQHRQPQSGQPVESKRTRRSCRNRLPPPSDRNSACESDNDDDKVPPKRRVAARVTRRIRPGQNEQPTQVNDNVDEDEDDSMDTHQQEVVIDVFEDDDNGNESGGSGRLPSDDVTPRIDDQLTMNQVADTRTCDDDADEPVAGCSNQTEQISDEMNSHDRESARKRHRKPQLNNPEVDDGNDYAVTGMTSKRAAVLRIKRLIHAKLANEPDNMSWRPAKSLGYASTGDVMFDRRCRRPPRSNEGFGEFVCRLCSARFTTKSTVERHQASVHAVNVMSFDCTECSFNSRRKDTLQQHMRRIHNIEVRTAGQQYEDSDHEIDFPIADGRTGFFCRKCPQLFENHMERQRHVRVAHPSAPKVFCCWHCTYSCARKDSLIRHMLLRHDIMVHSGDVQPEVDVSTVDVIDGDDYNDEYVNNTS